MSHVIYEDLVTVPASLPSVGGESLKDIWERSTKAERARILAALQAQITNSTDFTDKLAQPAADAYSSFVSTGWPNYEWVIMKHEAKLKNSYDEWLAGITAAFAVDGTFETNVTNKKDKFELARYTIACVGYKPAGTVGPAVLIAGAITNIGNTYINNYMGPDGALTDTSYMALLASVGIYARPTIISMLVQGTVLALFAHEAGDATLRDSILQTVETNLQEYLTQLQAAATTVTLTYEWSAGDAKVKMKIEATTT